MTLVTSTIKTPIGPFSFSVTEGKVIEATFGSSRKLRNRGRTVRSVPGVSKALVAYFAGDIRALDSIKVAGSETLFRRKVYRSMRRIRPGTTASYRDLARQSGSPDASRAVGSACARNPIPLIVPCHRVLPSDGSVGRYGYGTNRKRWLLEFEGAIPVS